MLVLGAMYFIGNQHNYTDSSLRIIVYTDMLFSLVQAVFIAYALVLMIITIIKTKKAKPLLYIFHYLGAFLIMAVSLSLSSILNYIQR